MKSLSRKLSLFLMALFITMGIVLAFIIRYSTEQYNLEITQRLNGSIAMYVAAEDQLIEHGKHNEEAIKTLAQRAMVINPTVEVYLLDKQGRISSHNLPPGSAIQNQIPLTKLKDFVQRESHTP